jgi:hypothetical protein
MLHIPRFSTPPRIPTLEDDDPDKDPKVVMLHILNYIDALDPHILPSKRIPDALRTIYRADTVYEPAMWSKAFTPRVGPRRFGRIIHEERFGERTFIICVRLYGSGKWPLCWVELADQGEVMFPSVVKVRAVVKGVDD